MTETIDVAPICTAIGRLLLEPPADNPRAAREHVRLFLNPAGAPCPPWQSVWEDDASLRRLLGPAHHSALRWFRQFGFEPNNETEPADHIGLLLLFYARLLEQQAPPAQIAAFEKEHLYWVSRFAFALETHAQTANMHEAGVILAELFPAPAITTAAPA
jgi:putative dimethyl sulfoxide reductase chaperone